jgi:hypothetical protein
MNSNKSGQALLLAALNRAAAPQGYSFSASDLTFSAVAASENPNREVQVSCTAVAESQFEGSKVVFFNRIDLGPLFSAAGYEAIEMIKGATTVGEVVDAINSRFDMGFTAEDFDLSIAVSSEDDTVVLEALPGSYAFKGQLLISMVVEKTQMDDAVVNPELAGMESDAQPQEVAPE